MTTGRTLYRHVSGPHAGDYYLLQDERSDCIFESRLAERIRAASGPCDEDAHLPAASLLEVWVDDANREVWYLFETGAIHPM